MGFEGAIWPVHRTAREIEGLPSYKQLEDLPEAPDATFIGVNRFTTVEAVKLLSDMNAGGAVCFASGFLEAENEDADGADLQRQLIAAAGEMPILGPNCYGFINYLDGALLWPDQHGGSREESGVAIVTQSSNIAVNLTMQRRGLPIAYIVTAGNQSQQSIGSIGAALLADPRVTALGLHIEGFGDLRAFEALSAAAREHGKPIIALKVGKSSQARLATISHTASLAGEDAGAQAFLDRLQIPRVNSLPEFLETLKLLHVVGRLSSNNIASISCSGGEASLCADLAVGRNLTFPPLSNRQRTNLRAALGPMVALANPLDYHTYIWKDEPAMTTAFSAMMDDPVALTMLIVDFPRADKCEVSDWESAINAAINCVKQTSHAVAMVATLQENMPEDVARRLIVGGVVPLMGMQEALVAIEAASYPYNPAEPGPILLPQQIEDASTLSEAEAKTSLAEFGINIPVAQIANSPSEAAITADAVGYPVVLKGVSIAHKTEVGAVSLNLQNAHDVRRAAEKTPCGTFLIEEMVTETLAELLIGVVRDPAHGYVLTIAAGGVFTELLKDSQSLLTPTTEAEISGALHKLRISKVLDGYRGANAANYAAIINAVMAVQNFVLANATRVEEVEINPLLCGADRAVAADALIRIAKEES
jgi:acyl-CoA synthetase (NDP forming)